MFFRKLAPLNSTILGLKQGRPFRKKNGNVNWNCLAEFIGTKTEGQVKFFAKQFNLLEHGNIYPEFRSKAAVDVWREVAAKVTKPSRFFFCFIKGIGGYLLSTYTKFSEKLTLLPPWYVHVRVRIRRWEMLVFRKILRTCLMNDPLGHFILSHTFVPKQKKDTELYLTS